MTFTATLHAGDPGRTGAHMVPGLLANARPEIASADAGVIRVEMRARFEGVPANLRPTHMGLWRGPVFIGGGALDTPTGSWTPYDTLTITAHLRFTFDAWRNDEPDA